MRIKGGGRVLVEVPRRPRARVQSVAEPAWYRDSFEVTPVRQVSQRLGATLTAVVHGLLRAGLSRIEEDVAERSPAQLEEMGRFLGRLSSDVVVELINHHAQHAPAQRAGPMVVLGAFVGALFVEFWAVQRGREALVRLAAGPQVEVAIRRELGVGAGEALEVFVTFLEQTEGQPARRLAGMTYAAIALPANAGTGAG